MIPLPIAVGIGGLVPGTSPQHVLELEYGVFGGDGGMFRLRPFSFQFSPDNFGSQLDMRSGDAITYALIESVPTLSYCVKDGVVTIELQQVSAFYGGQIVSITGMPDGLNAPDAAITKDAAYEFTYEAAVADTPRTHYTGGTVSITAGNRITTGLSFSSAGLLSGTPTEEFDPWDNPLTPGYPTAEIGYGDSQITLILQATNARTGRIIAGFFSYGYRMAGLAAGAFPDHPTYPSFEIPIVKMGGPSSGVSDYASANDQSLPNIQITRSSDGSSYGAVVRLDPDFRYPPYATGSSPTFLGTYTLDVGSLTIS